MSFRPKNAVAIMLKIFVLSINEITQSAFFACPLMAKSLAKILGILEFLVNFLRNSRFWLIKCARNSWEF